MDTTPVSSNPMSSTTATATATPTHNAGRRPQPSNITNLNAPAATRIPPSLQAKMAAVGTSLLPSSPPSAPPPRPIPKSIPLRHSHHSCFHSCSSLALPHPILALCPMCALCSNHSLPRLPGPQSFPRQRHPQRRCNCKWFHTNAHR